MRAAGIPWPPKGPREGPYHVPAKAILYQVQTDMHIMAWHGGTGGRETGW